MNRRFRVTSYAIAFCLLSANVAQAETVLITGANRGIGLEFAKQFAAMDWYVIATHRRETAPDTLTLLRAEFPKVQIETLDVNDAGHLEALVEKLNGRPIDLLLNNAGAMGIYNSWEGKENGETFGNMQREGFDLYFHTNVMAPVMITEALIDNVKASDKKIVASVSSDQGSSTRAYYPGGFIWYQATKAALNRAMVNLAGHLKEYGVTVLILSPTLTYTERMSFMREKRGDFGVDVDVAVAGFINSIVTAELDDAGIPIQWDGTRGDF